MELGTHERSRRCRHANHCGIPSLCHISASRNRGFSLIETLMALFVLMVGVIGAFAVVIQALHTSPTTRQEMIAAQLAQEGIEIARNIRDTRLLQLADDALQADAAMDKDWTQDFTGFGPPNEWRTVFEQLDGDDISSGWEAVSVGVGQVSSRARVFIAPSIGYMANVCAKNRCRDVDPAVWQDMGFRRVASILKYSGTTLNNGCATNDSCTEMRIKIKVYWNPSANPQTVPCPGPQCVLAEDRLTDWVDYLESIL